MKALIVDDSMTMRKIIAGCLQEIGFAEEDLEFAGDGAEAIRLIREKEFDIILLDWNMPKVNGLEALKKIRKEGFETPVIMVTTEGEKSRVVTAIQAGADNYIVKPFENSALNERIRACLGLA